MRVTHLKCDAEGCNERSPDQDFGPDDPAPDDVSTAEELPDGWYFFIFFAAGGVDTDAVDGHLCPKHAKAVTEALGVDPAV